MANIYSSADDFSLDLFSLRGKASVVTGSSTGLGQGICIAFARAGARVMGVDYVDSPETQRLIQSFGGDFSFMREDLLTTEPVARVCDTAVSRMGGLDILVNNAGIIRRHDALDYPLEDWDSVLALNLKTMFFLSQAAARVMVGQGRGGKIINIASLLSFQGGIRVPAYTAAKHGVAGVTQALCNEWAKYGICVNAIAPGYVATDNTAALRADAARYSAILERIPAGRWSTPADLMGAAVFLASAASDYVNGFTLAVDGGWLAR